MTTAPSLIPTLLPEGEGLIVPLTSGEGSRARGNSKKDELTLAIKTLADTAKQFVTVYASQQAQIVRLAKRVEEPEKANKISSN
ncbi:hypothetical protein GALLN_00550 [Gallionellaceae bacterium]|nr:hypothetical protein GALLN_00550 [Gallionellaceae bacterium]